MIKPRGQAVTDKILDTAERLFYQQGYHNTGINQVIEEADIAKASLYKHFISKEELMVAYLQRLYRRSLERLENDISNIADPKQKLLAIFDHYSKRQQIREYGGCPFIKANHEAGATDPRVLAEIQKAKERLKSIIKVLVENSGHKQILSDAELTETIFLMNEGAIVAASVFKQGSEISTAKAIIEKFI